MEDDHENLEIAHEPTGARFCGSGSPARDFMRKHWCEAGAHRSAAAAAKHRVLEPHVVRVRVKP